jgi:hypothetical protein
MREAATRPTAGPTGTDTLAAIGGLDVPGREPHAHRPGSVSSPVAATQAASHDLGSPSRAGTASHGGASALIPGERDASTLTHREPGAVGGQFAGADIPAASPQGWMDERTASDRAHEGGGSAAKKSHDTTHR